MIEIENRQIIPIGCSCISQFQIAKHFAPRPTQAGFFDWNIATPAASADVMRAYMDQSLLPKLADRAAYGTLSARKYLINKHFPGLYFWHEPSAEVLDPARPERFNAFVNKLRYLVRQTFAPRNTPALIWSNVQPNLKIVTARVTDDWSQFCLTPARYERLNSVAAQLFAGPDLYFAVNPEDCAPELLDQPNVFALGLPRCGKYVGPKGHFAAIFGAIDGVDLAKTDQPRPQRDQHNAAPSLQR